MRSAKRYYWILAVVVACVIVAVAWLMQKSQPPAEKVTIAALALPGAGLFFVAQEKGFFREQGLDVDLQKHTVGKLALDSLFSGDAAFAVAGDTPLVFSILGGSKLEILSTVYRPNGGISIVALKERVPTPGNLRGKRLGATFISSGQFVADTFLLLHGMSQTDVTVLDMKQNDMVEALLAGKIDAASLWHPHLAEAQTKLGNKGITFPNNGLYTFRLSLVANRGYVTLHPEQAKKVVAALKQAQRYIVEHPADALRIMSQATAIADTTYKTFFNPSEYVLGLEQGLLITFEDQTRWALKRGLVKTDRMPNYLDYIQFDALRTVSPESMKIIR